MCGRLVLLSSHTLEIYRLASATLNPGTDANVEGREENNVSNNSNDDVDNRFVTLVMKASALKSVDSVKLTN